MCTTRPGRWATPPSIDVPGLTLESRPHSQQLVDPRTPREAREVCICAGDRYPVLDRERCELRVWQKIGSDTADVAAPAGPGDDGVLSSVDDPEKSPYPIWDPTTPYPIGVKVVWQLQVYQAKRWSTGFAPDTMVARPEDTPWRLIGPVAPGGEEPVPLPSVSAGTYPEWDPAKEYPTGSRIQMGTTPFVAKWWNQGKQPDPEGGTKHPWAVLLG